MFLMGVSQAPIRTAEGLLPSAFPRSTESEEVREQLVLVARGPRA